MRLLIVAAFDNESFGGGEVLAWQIASGMSRRSHEVQLVSSHLVENVSVPYLREDIYRTLPITRLYLPINRRDEMTVLFDPWLNQSIRSLLDIFQPDLIHINDFHHYSVSIVDEAISGLAPTLFMAHDYWPMCNRIFRTRADGSVCWEGPGGGLTCAECYANNSAGRSLSDLFIRHIVNIKQRIIGKSYTELLEQQRRERFVLRNNFMLSRLQRVDCCLCVSAFQAQEYIRWGIPPNRAHVISLGTDYTSTQYEPTVGDRPVRGVYVGRLNTVKGIQILLDAMCEFDEREFVLDIFGGPNNVFESGFLQKYVSLSNVHFHGQIDHAKIQSALARAHALILPSIVMESSPLVLREALAMKVPVIASNIGGIPEIVRHQVNGLLFIPGDVRDLQRTMRRLLNEPGLLYQLRSQIEPQKSTVQYLGEVESLYESLILKRRGTT